MLRIVTDSSAEISQKHAAELGIEVLPLTIIFGTEQFRDGIDMMPGNFIKGWYPPPSFRILLS